MSVDRRLRDAISDEMLDRLARSHGRADDLETVHHTVQVTSFGGSATTALYDHLMAAGADIPMTPGQFPFKHQRVPPANDAVPEGFRVVYPFADPRNAVVSLFRRGYQGGHYRGMRLRTPTAEVEQTLLDLDHFLEAGVDEFGLADQFDRWYARGTRAYPVLFLKYENLATAWPEVREFIGLPADYPCLATRARESEWQATPDSVRARLDEMYGDLARRLAALPTVDLR